MIKSKIDINRIARVLTMEDNIKESFNIINKCNGFQKDIIQVDEVTLSDVQGDILAFNINFSLIDCGEVRKNDIFLYIICNGSIPFFADSWKKYLNPGGSLILQQEVYAKFKCILEIK